MVGTIDPEQTFECMALHCKGITLRCCVMRQVVSDAQRIHRRSDLARGQASDYPHCVTGICVQGTKHRELLDPDRAQRWEPHGLSGFGRPIHQTTKQMAERARRLLIGLDSEVPTVDTPPTSGPLEDDGSEQPTPEAAADQGKAPGSGATLRAGPVRQPWGKTQGSAGVQGVGTREGDGHRAAAVALQRGGGAPEGGEHGVRGVARLRLGKADAGTRAVRPQRQAAVGRGPRTTRRAV